MGRLPDPYVEWPATSKLEALLRRFPVVVATGARQVGKSTLPEHSPWAAALVELTFDG